MFGKKKESTPSLFEVLNRANELSQRAIEMSERWERMATVMGDELRRCNRRDEDRIAWDMFAAAALISGDDAEDAAAAASRMLELRKGKHA